MKIALTGSSGGVGDDCGLAGAPPPAGASGCAPGLGPQAAAQASASAIRGYRVCREVVIAASLPRARADESR